MFSLFKKFKDGLTKTVAAIAAKTHGLFGGRKIAAASLDELEEALYTADFGVETTEEIIAEVETPHAAPRFNLNPNAATFVPAPTNAKAAIELPEAVDALPRLEIRETVEPCAPTNNAEIKARLNRILCGFN